MQLQWGTSGQGAGRTRGYVLETPRDQAWLGSLQPRAVLCLTGGGRRGRPWRANRVNSDSYLRAKVTGIELFLAFVTFEMADS